MFGFFKRKNRLSKQSQVVRGFAAAEVSRLLAPWNFDGGFSNNEVSAALSTVRQRSREMQKNSEHFANFLRLFKNNVVGQGFTLKSQPCEMVGSPNVDEAAKNFIQYHFWKWATNRDEVDMTGRKTFAAICRLLAENWARDGEGFVLLERNAPSEYGLRLRVIRPDGIDETMNGPGTTDATIVRNGVEVDRRTLRPVAYYLKAANEDPSAGYYLNRKVYRVAAGEILHLYTQHDETQTRGMPLGHAVLKKLKMLDLYNEAELVAARDEANTTGIYHAPMTAGGEMVNYDESDAVALTMPSEPGTKIMLDPGWDYKTVTPTHPNREAVNMTNAYLRAIAVGLGVEYANFTGDWDGVSYSSVRVGTLCERDNWKVLQQDFIEQIAAPVFRYWLASFLSRPVANPYVPSDFARLCEFDFQARTWEWVDPMKDVNAAVIAVAHGWKTNEEITAQFGGADFIENCARLKIENEAKKDAGILTSPPNVEEDPKNGGDNEEE
jgi:lambda family phage portal protein